MSKNLLPGASPIQSQEELEVIRTAWILGVEIQLRCVRTANIPGTGWETMPTYHEVMQEIQNDIATRGEWADGDYWINYVTGRQHKYATLTPMEVNRANSILFRIKPQDKN